MADNANPFGATGKARPKSAGTGGSTGPSITLGQPSLSVVRFLDAAIHFGGGLAEFPVWSSNAQRVDDLAEATEDEEVLELLQGLQEDGIEVVSFEDFFSVDLEGEGVEFVGTPPLLKEKGDGEYSELDEETKGLYTDDDIYVYGEEENGLKAYILEPDWLDSHREGKIDGNVINMANYVLNGFYYDVIQNLSGQDTPSRMKVSIGRSYNHRDEEGDVDEFAKRRHVSFTYETSESTDQRIISAAKFVGALSEDDIEGLESGELDLDDVADRVAEHRD